MISWILNDMLLQKGGGVSEKIKTIKKYLETNDNENTTIQKSMGCSKSSS